MDQVMKALLFLALSSSNAMAQYMGAQFGAGANIYAGAQLGANAQFGAGTYMGNYCPYQYEMAEGAQDESDEVYRLKKEKEKLSKQMAKAKRKQEAARKEYEEYAKAIKDRFQVGAANTIIEHIEQGLNKNQWTDKCQPTAQSNTPGGAAVSPLRVPGVCVLDGGNYYPVAWFNDGGDVSSVACQQTHPSIVKKSGDEIRIKIRCERALSSLASAKSKYVEATTEFETAKADLERAKLDLESEKDRLANRDDDEKTEAEVCVNCGTGRRRLASVGPSNGQLALGGLLGVLGGVLAYKGGKYTVDQNANLGWQTNPMWSASLGLGMLSAGVGAAFGGGVNGCAMGGAYPGSPFYNPYAANPMMGGGMWMPGANAMLGGMYDPYGGMMGGMMGNPMFGNPMMAGMMGNPMFGNPMMGGMMGNPMFGNPMMGGMNGMANPYLMQMQQQMLQLQQAQMRDYAYRQQTVMGLQQQMYQIQMQIYQISSGGYYSGGGSPTVLPYPYGNGTGTGTSPGYVPGTLVNTGSTPGSTYTPRTGR